MAELRDPVTFCDLTLTALRRHAGLEAFRQDGLSLTCAEVEDHISRVVALLRARGFERGQGVGVLSPNRPEVFTAQTAPLFAGGRYTALHPLGSFEDHRYAVDEAEIRYLLVDPAYASRGAELLAACSGLDAVFSFGPAPEAAGVEDLEPLIAAVEPARLEFGMRRPDELAWLLYTGGTTGVPKAAMLPERAVAQTVFSVSLGWDIPKDRRYLAVAPISHAAGMLIVPTLIAGGSVTLMRGFDPGKWLETVARDRITLSLLVPTMIYAVLDHPDLDTADLSSLETIMYGASPMSPSRLVEGIRRIGPVFAQLYGQTECAGLTTSMGRAEHDVDDVARLSSCGQVMPGVRIAVLDEQGRPCPEGEPGEVCVQGISVMDGYWKQPELTAQTIVDGWLHTGDIGVVSPDGFLTLVDRKKDMIVSGGFNVFPREIEDVLSAHPAVSSAAVIGVPDDKWGEAVTALIVLRPGATCEPDELRQLVKDRKGAIYTPKTVEFVDALPLTAVGKPDKKVLRARYWGDRQRAVN
jgi:fatty-acyl-CoA synthase